MRTGASWLPGWERSIACLLLLCLLKELSLAAPGLPGTQREDASRVLANPFGSREEDRRLLQSYIQASLTESQGPELSTFEQEVFFLFRLYDFDRSGHMDGLEMMKLLSDFNSQESTGVQSNGPVVSMVDFLLQTQDLNQDGLLAPSELLSPPLPYIQESHNKQPHQVQEVAAEDKLPSPNESPDEMAEAELPPGDERGENAVREEQEVPSDQGLQTNHEGTKPKGEEENQLQIQEGHLDPLVHQGQPEM